MNTTLFTTLYLTSPANSGRPTSGQVQVDASQSPVAGGRALVLGGGGSAGNAWLIGVVAGLFEAGLDVTQAELIIGTSAGATAAAQLSSANPLQLLADILTATPQQRRSAAPGQRMSAAPQQGGSALAQRRTGAGESNAARPPRVDHLRRTSEIIAASQGPADMRRRLGASALEIDAASDGSWSTQWRATVAARLPSQDWPQQLLHITAVDARTGQPVVFDRHSGVDLADAIAASTASGPPYAIGDSRYIDGGYRRSSENADLAAGYERVLVLSPFGGRSRAPEEWNMQLAAQVDELQAGGSTVETILPDTNALEAFGTNMMDLSRRLPAAQAGYDQGKATADHLTTFWR
ncbi:MAG: hypothetical protein QOH03_3407 [Kribbellaceae bacterium]|nr:hypothetical protein [Kribbellaceae bacterium]